MANTECNPQEAGRLSGLTIAFDLDNTLYSPEPSSYTDTVKHFLSRVDTGLAVDDAVERHQELRSMGAVLERMGLPNPLHIRGNAETLSLFCLMYASNKSLLHDLGIGERERRLATGVVERVAGALSSTCEGTLSDRLLAEIEARRLCATSEDVKTLVDVVRTLAQTKIIRDWALGYGESEKTNAPVTDFTEMLASLKQMGANLVVISEGLDEVQSSKLKKLGLCDVFENHVLVSESAGRLSGIDDLRDAIDSRVESATSAKALAKNDDLLLLWYYDRLIDTWRHKTSAFYARCLHAIHAKPTDPQDALAEAIVVPREKWLQQPLRFVMIGDRFDKDVLPLVELLGPRMAYTIRLTQGRYRDTHPDSDVPAHLRPTKTFLEWESLSEYLLDRLSLTDVHPIGMSPDLLRRPDLVPEYVTRGLDSELQVVRTVAKIASGMTRR